MIDRCCCMTGSLMGKSSNRSYCTTGKWSWYIMCSMWKSCKWDNIMDMSHRYHYINMYWVLCMMWCRIAYHWTIYRRNRCNIAASCMSYSWRCTCLCRVNIVLMMCCNKCQMNMWSGMSHLLIIDTQEWSMSGSWLSTRHNRSSNWCSMGSMLIRRWDNTQLSSC